MKIEQAIFLILLSLVVGLSGCAYSDSIDKWVDQRRLDEASAAIQKISPHYHNYAHARLLKANIHAIREEHAEQITAAREAIAADWRVDDGAAFTLLWEAQQRLAPTEANLTTIREQIWAKGQRLLDNNPDDRVALLIAIAAADIAGQPDSVDLKYRLIRRFPDSKEVATIGHWIWLDADKIKDAAKRKAFAAKFAAVLPHDYFRSKLITLQIYAINELEGGDATLAALNEWTEREPLAHYGFYITSIYFAQAKNLSKAVDAAHNAVLALRTARSRSRHPVELDPLEVAYLRQWAETLLADNQPKRAIPIANEAKKLGANLSNPNEHTATARSIMNGLQSAPSLVLAKAYEALDRNDEAIDAYIEAAVQSDSHNILAPVAEAALARLLEGQIGDSDTLQSYCAARVGKTVPLFEDVTEQFGLSGVSSSGVSFGDYNGDGWIDLSTGGRLWRNDGGKTFVDVTDTAKVSGGIWVDLDNDGDIDSVGADYAIHWNNGEGLFTRTALPVPLWAFAPDKPYLGKDKKEENWYASSVAAVDFDGDGLLDLYFANMPSSTHGGHGLFPERAPDFVYKNLGDGKFEEVSAALGIDRLTSRWCGRGLNSVDYDNDGDTDLFISNYSLHPNLLWRNDGSGHFENVSFALNLDGNELNHYWGHTIGSAWGDLDNDGDMDLVTANLAHPRYIEFSDVTKVYRNDGGPGWTFSDVTPSSGVAYDETHSDAALVDADNDGDLDLSLTQIYPSRRTYLYLNDGNGHFEEVTWFAGVRHFDAWQHAWADIDNDGDQDLLVASNKAGVRLYRNLGNGNHWLTVQVQGHHCNRSGIGARVTVSGNVGRQIRDVVSTRGNGSQDDIRTHFGLGESSDPVTVTVRFPCGTTVERNVVAPDQLLIIDEPDNGLGS